jgi:TusA-related sulfurtransferase
MTTAPEFEEMDLRGKRTSEQLKAALASLDRAAEGTPIKILTDQEILVKALPMSARDKGLKIKLAMPSESEWSIILTRQS